MMNPEEIRKEYYRTYVSSQSYDTNYVQGVGSIDTLRSRSSSFQDYVHFQYPDTSKGESLDDLCLLAMLKKIPPANVLPSKFKGLHIVYLFTGEIVPFADNEGNE